MYQYQKKPENNQSNYKKANDTSYKQAQKNSAAQTPVHYRNDEEFGKHLPASWGRYADSTQQKTNEATQYKTDRNTKPATFAKNLNTTSRLSEMTPTIVPTAREIRTKQLKEQEEEIRQNKPSGMSSNTYLKLANPQESAKMEAQAKFANYKKSQAKQLKRDKQATRLFNRNVSHFERTLVQRKIDYGSEEYNNLIGAHFPDLQSTPHIAENNSPIQKSESQGNNTSVNSGSGNSFSEKTTENNTGLPDNLKDGVENLSGLDMSDVQVHTNSAKPTEVGAHAYTQGTDIHVAPGQEKHLPHEAWHVAQQKQGRVKPTMQMSERSRDPDSSGNGMVNINDEKGLENEADVMGEKALSFTPKNSYQFKILNPSYLNENNPIQLVKFPSKFDPQNAKVKRQEAELDSDNYSFDEMVSILVHGRNAYLYSNESFKAFARELITEDKKGNWITLLGNNPGLVQKADGIFKKRLDLVSPIEEAARNFLENINGALEKSSFFMAKKLANLEESEATEYDELFQRAIRQDRESKELEVLNQKKALQKRAGKFILLAAYFSVEIPNEFSDLREDFLIEIGEMKEQLGVYDDIPGENITEENIELFIKNIIEQARSVFNRIAEQEPDCIPSTFMDSLAPDYKKRVVGIKQRIQAILSPYAVLIADIVPGSKLKYRGSLTDGIKNFTKSKPVVTKNLDPEPVLIDFGKKALEVNINAFDIDAFIEIPDELWLRWEEAEIVPDRKKQAIKGKIILEDWIPDLEEMIRRGNFAAYITLSLVKNIRKIERFVQNDLKSLSGYKIKEDSDEADFEMVLQPVEKTVKSVAYGKPYPMGELSRGGSAYEELMARFDQLREHDLDEEAAWLPEKNVEIAPPPKNPSIEKAKEMIDNPFRMLSEIDLSGIEPPLLPEQIESLISSIENGDLPFLNKLRINAQSITLEQRERIRSTIPVFFSLIDNETLNF